MSYQHLPETLDIVAAPFLARLTAVYTVPSGPQAGLNLYTFVECAPDPATGIPNDAEPGRQTQPTVGTPTSGYALEVNNTLLTVPGSTPTGYTNAGPYVTMKLRGTAGGVPVYEFTNPAQISTLSANVSAATLSTSWANIGTSLTLPANSSWVLMAQINGQIVSSSTGAGDSLSCRFYDGTSVVGCPVEFCNAVCDSLTYVDAGWLVAPYAAGSSGATVNIQGIVNTSSGSTGSILACGSLAGGQMVGMRAS